MTQADTEEDVAPVNVLPTKEEPKERELLPYMVVLAGQDRVIFAEDEADLQRRIAKQIAKMTS